MKKSILASFLVITSMHAAAHRQPMAVVKAVQGFSMDRVIERYKKDYNVPCQTAKKHEQELRRYLTLCALYPASKFPMFSKEVDDFWHTFLLFTQEYQSFCEHFAGRFIHHDPRDHVNKKLDPEQAKIAYDDFAEKYLELFHEMPDEHIWTRGQKEEECETCGDKCCHHGDACKAD